MAELHRSQLSRRAFLSAGAAAALGGGTALVFGCGGGGGRQDQTSSAGGVSAPRQGGELVIGRYFGVLGVDPHLDTDISDIAHLIYSQLYTWHAQSGEAMFNDFAESMEIPDAQGREFIFHLRRGVKIHSHPDNPVSGQDLTSEDCKQSFIRRGTALTAPDKRLALAIAGTQTVDAAALRAALQTPDPYTFSFKLSRTFVSAFRELAKPEWSIVPAAVIEKYGSSFQQPFKLFGSGPFMLDEFRGTERIVLVRHPEYFLQPRPWLERIIFIVISTPETLVSRLKSGGLDISPPIGREDYLELKDDPRFTLSQAPTLSYPALHLKMRPPFSDIRVREAIDLALNRDKFIDEVWGGEAEYNGPVPWPLEGWSLPQSELRRAYAHGPDRARQLLHQAGYAEGFKAKLAIPRKPFDAIFDVEQAASVIAQDLSEIGISLELEAVEPGEFIANTILPGNFEMAFFRNTPYDNPDRPLAYYHTRGITGAGNWNGYSNPELDTLIEAQSEEFDEARRRDLVLEAQRRIIAEHGPQLTLPSGYEYHARRAYVHYPYEIGERPTSGAGPWGSDIWTEEA